MKWSALWWQRLWKLCLELKNSRGVLQGLGSRLMYVRMCVRQALSSLKETEIDEGSSARRDGRERAP